MKLTRLSWLGLTVCALGACFGSGHNSTTQSGFGKACAVAADCEQFSLMCDSVRGCVECVLNSDCGTTEVCSAGKCETQGGCREDRDCASGRSCATAAGVCVDCWRSSDCPTDQICVDLSCTAATSCVDLRDCPSGQVCDSVAGSCVECLDAGDCGTSESCEAQICVPVATTGSGGTSSGGTSSGGTSNGGSSNGGTTNGGTSNGGTSNGGTTNGGTGNTCNCLDGLERTVGGDCVDPDVIVDTSLDCSNSIIQVRGRSSMWFGEADTGINLMFGVSPPGTGWVDNTCAAWAVGGPLVGGTQYWALLGFSLADGAPYSLAEYNGVAVSFEGGGQNYKLVVRNPVDEYFESVTGPTSGVEERLFYFAELVAAPGTVTTLDLTKVIQIHLSPVDDPANFGFAIHSVSLF